MSSLCGLVCDEYNHGAEKQHRRRCTRYVRASDRWLMLSFLLRTLLLHLPSSLPGPDVWSAWIRCSYIVHCLLLLLTRCDARRRSWRGVSSWHLFVSDNKLHRFFALCELA